MEPASASGLAALKHQFESGDIVPSGKTFVVVLTGHGLKEPDITIDMASKPLRYRMMSTNWILIWRKQGPSK